MAKNDKPNWDRLEADGLRKIRLLRAACEHTAVAIPEGHKAMKRGLYLPALSHLAAFCSCVEETDAEPNWRTVPCMLARPLQGGTADAAQADCEGRVNIVPIRQSQAKRFIAQNHRHNDPSIGSVFNIGLADSDGELIGVAMCGIPKARLLMDGQTLEVTRVAVKEGTKNSNSCLYSACARAAKALGYKRLLTYTLESESGVSLRAAGWK